MYYCLTCIVIISCHARFVDLIQWIICECLIECHSLYCLTCIIIISGHARFDDLIQWIICDCLAEYHSLYCLTCIIIISCHAYVCDLTQCNTCSLFVSALLNIIHFRPSLFEWYCNQFSCILKNI